MKYCANFFGIVFAAGIIGCGGEHRALRTPERTDGACGVPTAPNGYCVTGNQILDTNGKPRIFHGVNRPSLEFDFYGRYFCKEDYDEMKRWGADTVRIPLSQAYWLSNDQYKATVDKAVTAARQAGLDVILDLHWSTKDNTDAPGMQDMPDTYSEMFWQDLAPRYKNDGGVIYELYNEPRSVSWQQWRKGGRHLEGWQMVGMQQLYDAVRSTGAHNLILIGGLNWAYELTDILRHPIKGYNIAYTTHLYPYVGKQPQDWAEDWLFLVDKVPLLITEFGPDGDTGDLNYVKQVVDTAKKNNLGWIAWAWYPFANNNFFSKWSPESGVYELTPYGNLIRTLLSGDGR